MEDLLAQRLSVNTHEGKEFIFVDYSGLKEDEMIKLAGRHTALTLARPLPFLADLSNTYLTPAYMNHVRQYVADTKSLMSRGALIGIDPVKSMILKGLVFFSGVDYRAFDTREKALKFLLSDSKL